MYLKLPILLFVLSYTKLQTVQIPVLVRTVHNRPTRGAGLFCL